MNSAGVFAQAGLCLNGPQLLRIFLFLDDIEAKLEAADEMQVGRNDVGMVKKNRLICMLSGRALKDEKEDMKTENQGQ